MTRDEAETKIEEFLAKVDVEVGETPTDEEVSEIATIWEDYIRADDLVRGLWCKRDFTMGMIIMGKLWAKTNKKLKKE